MRGSKFAVSYRKAWSPLTRCCTTAQLVILTTFYNYYLHSYTKCANTETRRPKPTKENNNGSIANCNYSAKTERVQKTKTECKITTVVAKCC